MHIELLEAFMLICWGSSWPFSIAKILQTRSVEGKSALFLILILCGYVAAITAQFFRGVSPIVLLYFFNASMIFTDLCLVLHFRYGKHQRDPSRQYLKDTFRYAENKKIITGLFGPADETDFVIGKVPISESSRVTAWSNRPSIEEVGSDSISSKCFIH